MNANIMKICAVIAAMLLGIQAFAQSQVRGSVMDREGGLLPGVVVQVQGKPETATISDINGYYVINASAGDKLEFSCLGYKTAVLTAPKSLSLYAYLDEDTLEMEEAVVVGMGKQRKISVIGAVTAIDKSELQIPQRSLTNALAGKVAGAVVVQRSGEPGVDEAEFWIRGISSFTTSSPLILVDGVERSMSDLAIEEIESISILKDASATAVYGVRAANGVVIVTTRRGLAQKPVIDVKIEGGISDLTKIPDLIDGANYMRLANEANGTALYSDYEIDMTESKSDPYLYPNINWFDEIFTRWSSNKQASVSVRGGGERARYYTTIAYINEIGNLRDDSDASYSTNINLDRYNFRTNVDLDLTKSTVLTIEVGGNMTKIHQPAPITSTTSFASVASELFSECYAQKPIGTPVYVPIGVNADGTTEYGFGSELSVSTGNPAERLFGSGYNETYKSQIMSQIILKQDLEMITPGLSAQVSFSYDANNQTVQSRRRYSSLYAINGVDDMGEYILAQTRIGDEYLGYSYATSNNRADELKAQILYDRVFNEKHRVGGMAMYYQRDYVVDSGNTISSLPYKKQGLAFRGTYSYADRYFVEVNAGYNGTENFEKGNRFGLFPAGALGYLISAEPWWNVDCINHLKIRGSIGLVGSDALTGERFAYLSTWGSGITNPLLGTTGHYFGEGQHLNGVGESKDGVSNLTWEKGLKENIGLELKMFSSRVSLDFDYFHERRTDILIQRQSIPAIAGFNSSPYANLGIMENGGFEVSAEFSDKIGDFGYRIYGNMSYAHNTIIEKDEAQSDPWRMATGHRYGQQFGYVALGYFESEEDIASSPSQEALGNVRVGDVKYLDYNEDGVINYHDQCAIGYSYIPEINYGFGFQLTYKGFDFGMFFRGQGNVSYDLGSTYYPFYTGVGKNNLFACAVDHVKVLTDENGVETIDPATVNARYARLSASASTNNQQSSTYSMYDGSFVRLSDVELGYTFKSDILSKIGASAARVYFVGNNLAYWSKWDLWDPETGSSNGSKYPLVRKFNLGVRISF